MCLYSDSVSTYEGASDIPELGDIAIFKGEYEI